MKRCKLLCLAGYRHLQLRNQQNEAVAVSSLFIYSHRSEDDGLGGSQPASAVSVKQLTWMIEQSCS